MRKLSGILLILVLLAAWELSARFALVPSSSWPSLSSTILEIGTGFQTGELLTPWLETLRHVFAGFAIGASLGVLLGLICGRWPVLNAIIDPIVETLRPIPTPAIIPPLILLLGIQDTLKNTVIAIAVFFPVFINTVSGVRMTSGVLIDTARTFHIAALRVILCIIFPAALPAIMAGLRVAIGLALVVTIVAEMTAGSSGFGYYIVQMQFAMRPQAMYASIIILALTGYALNAISLRIERSVLHWKPS